MKRMFKKLTAGVCAAAMTLAALNNSPAVMQVEAGTTASTFIEQYKDTYYSTESTSYIPTKVTMHFNQSGFQVGIGDPDGATPEGYGMLFDGLTDTSMVFARAYLMSGDYMQLDFKYPVTLSAVDFKLDTSGTFGFKDANITVQTEGAEGWQSVTTNTTTAAAAAGSHSFTASSEEARIQKVTAVRLTSTYTKGGQGWNSFYEVLIDAEPTTGFTDASITLDGKIGLNFKANIADDLAEGAYVKFKVGEGDDAVYDEGTVTGNLSSGKYSFTREVCAAEMTQKITAELYDAEDNLLSSKEYSVLDYAEAVLEAIEAGSYTDADGKLAALLKAMLNYGAWAQTYFGVDAEKLANVGLTDEEKNAVAEVNDGDFELWENTHTAPDVTSWIQGTSLILEGTTTLRITLAEELGDGTGYTFTWDENSVTPKRRGETSKYYIEVQNIAAAELHKNKELVITRTEDEKVVKDWFNALTYASRVVETYGDSTEESMTNYVNLMKALYLYNRAAVDHFGEN